jgi:hypothetical protein
VCTASGNPSTVGSATLNGHGDYNTATTIMLWPTTVANSFNGNTYTGWSSTAGTYTVPNAAGPLLIIAQYDLTLTSQSYIALTAFINGAAVCNKVGASTPCMSCKCT